MNTAAPPLLADLHSESQKLRCLLGLHVTNNEALPYLAEQNYKSCAEWASCDQADQRTPIRDHRLPFDAVHNAEDLHDSDRPYGRPNPAV